MTKIAMMTLDNPIPLSGPFSLHEWASCEFGPCYLNLDMQNGKGAITLTKEEAINLADEIRKEWKDEHE